MHAKSRAKALVGVAAGATVAALFASTLAIPASAAPVDATLKIKLADAANVANVIKGKYLVETAGTPLTNGGNALANKVTQDGVKAAASFSGVRVTDAQSDIWAGLTVTANEQQIRKLAESPGVKAIYPVLRVQLPKTVATKTKVTSALADISAVGTTYTGSGIRVGVVDSGIDYNNADLGGSGAPDNNADFGSNAPRVRYGYDFVGDEYDGNSTPVPDAFPDDCHGHGTHVAGIIGAAGDPDNGGALGVAPKVTLGAYRVFGCEGGTDTSIILKALAMAKKDQMQVINLSIGSDFGNWPNYPEAVAASNLTKSGIVVVAAAGNSGDTGLFSAGTPAVGAGVISVGSFESEKIRTRAIGVGANTFAYTQVARTAPAPVDNATVTLALASNTTACSTPTSVPANTALLIKRGECFITTKVASALAAGAVAVVIYKEAPGLGDFTTAPDSFSIPAISIGGTEGDSLSALITASGPQTMTWLDYQKDLSNPDGGAISAFSSAGLAADLSLVPTISAPGGKIYSTLPIEQGRHGNLSGTSMATPFVTGSVAVLMEARPELKGKPSSVAQRLYNTAVPVANATEQGVTNHPEAVFRQGSGVVQVQNAINAAVTASPSTIKLGEGTSQKVTVKLTNRTRQTLTYTPSRVSGVSAAASTSSVSTAGVGTTSPDYAFGEVGFKSYAKKVKIRPGKSAKISLKIYAPGGVLKGRAGLLYGGWVNFTTTGAGNSISIPFAGVRGNFQSVKVLNKFAFSQGGASWALPALGYVDAGSLYPEYSNTRTYTMDDAAHDHPFVLYHLDYPASDVRVKVTNTKTRKSYYAIIDWNASSASKATHLNKESRDVSLQYIEFNGAYLSKRRAKFLPSGAYQLQLRVLKPLGTASRSSHWETFTTRVFNIQWCDE